MPKTDENLAAILAEMRGNEFDDPHLDADGIIGARRLARDWADRIEAAAKRETESLRVEAESEKRWACEYFALARRREDALTHCKQYAQKIERENEEGETRLDAEEIIATVDNEFAGIRPERAPGNAAELREALIYVRDLMRRVKDGDRVSSLAFLGVVEHALAAPARNCDRFKTLDEAREAFQDLRGHKILADVELWDSMDEAGALVRWLFAPAEGGAKCIDGLRGHPDCRGCEEDCLDVRKRNCFYWNPGIGKCALDGSPSCRIACDNFHVSKEEKPGPAEGWEK